MKRRITSGYYDWYHRRYAPIMNKLVLASGHDTSVRDDLFAVSQLAVLGALIDFDRERGVSIVTVIHNRIYGAISNYRHREQRQTRPVTIDTPELMTSLTAPEGLDPDTAISVEEILSCLDVTERRVVWMSLAKEMSSREIAPHIGKSYDTVCRIKNEALRKIAERFPDAKGCLKATAA